MKFSLIKLRLPVIHPTCADNHLGAIDTFKASDGYEIETRGEFVRVCKDGKARLYSSTQVHWADPLDDEPTTFAGHVGGAKQHQPQHGRRK